MDPLEAFMAGVHAKVEEEEKAPARSAAMVSERLEAEDHHESFAAQLAANRAGAAGKAGARAATGPRTSAIDEINGAFSGGGDFRKALPPLKPFATEPYQKNFCRADCAQSVGRAVYDEAAFARWAAAHAVTISTPSASPTQEALPVPPPPAQAWESLRAPLGSALLDCVQKRLQYSAPTVIQAAALPTALSGRDALCLAPTGGGKTAAFALPLAVHVTAAHEALSREALRAGPTALVLAPSRELAAQIATVVRRFLKVLGCTVSTVYGGVDKTAQYKELKAGVDAIVATPGRLIDVLRGKATDMQRVTLLVLDEADSMLSMGFSEQVNAIIGRCRPDRQTLLFSATLPPKLESLAAGALRAPVRITVGGAGGAGGANADVRQLVHVVRDADAKDKWLIANISAAIDEGGVIVFASTRARVEEVEEKLKQIAGVKAVGVHGERSQPERTAAVKALKNGDAHVLVATNLAARGLDVPDLNTVICLDASRDAESHTHRIGRTGRAGSKHGVAHVLLTPNESKYAATIARGLAVAGQPLPEELLAVARRDRSFAEGGTRDDVRGAGGRVETQHMGGGGLQAPRPSEAIASAADKLARFVARNGPAFEAMARQRQGSAPEFAFLFGGEGAQYYRERVAAEAAALRGEGAPDPKRKRLN
eukprot:PRCOL_00003186-RA